ncbi:aminotransferase class V-fold PLP-dependent enzyme [Spirosoma soli]|uniref:Aminotransferase class V-fold PLP-dependent enzyme n=1 Tax=Spirosoma soli TaxID=1770529 RepID=A0ABW5M7V1_9BACT
METVSKASLVEKIYQSQYCTHQCISGPFGKRLITYADHIASGQSLIFIEEYLQDVVLPTYANTHTEASFTGRQTSHYREEARQFIKQSVNAGPDDVVLFCGSGSTSAIDKVVRRLQVDRFHRQNKPVVFLGPYEHHSNLLPWREGNFDVVQIPVDKEGLIDLHVLEEKLQHYQYTARPLIGSFWAASNVTGILAPVDSITALLHQYGALSFWDYAAAAPYTKINMNPGTILNKDGVFISAHKFVGGPSTPGILVVKKHLFNTRVPTMPSGGTVHFVTKTQQRYFEDIETREEGGTPAIIDSIRAGLVFKLKDTVGADYIEKRERNYITRAIHQFKQHPNVYILGNTDVARLGFLAFHIRCADRFLHHNFVVALLNDLFGIQARGGCSCAGPYGHDLLALSETKSQAYMDELATGNVGSKPGWVRLNFNYFIPEAEFLFIVDAILWLATHGWKLLNFYEFDDQTALWHPLGYKAPVSSLSNFLTHKQAAASKTAIDRVNEYESYLQQANALAGQALMEWPDVTTQTYRYSQVTNPLRWYALADDMVVEDTIAV